MAVSALIYLLRLLVIVRTDFGKILRSLGNDKATHKTGFQINVFITISLLYIQ